MIPKREETTDHCRSRENFVQLLVAHTKYQDVLRHLSRALRGAISSAHHTVVSPSIVRYSASFWTPPSHYNTVVTAENIFQYVIIDTSNPETTYSELFFISLLAVCRATAGGPTLKVLGLLH